MFAARIENAQNFKEVYGLSQGLLHYYLDLVQQQNLPQGSKLLRQVIEIVQLDFEHAAFGAKHCCTAGRECRLSVAYVQKADGAFLKRIYKQAADLAHWSHVH